MTEHAAAASRGHETTLDRAGLALASGGTLGGVTVLLLVIAAGQRDPVPLMTAAVLGTFFAMLGITALAAPLWLVLHLAGYRRAWHAAALGAGLAMIVFVAGQTHGFGLFGPVGGEGTLLFRWLSALATSALLAALAAGIAIAMWRVAYRPA